MSKIFDSIIIREEFKKYMSDIQKLQAELNNDQTPFERKLEIKDEIRKLEGKETINTCELGSDCENCSG